MNTFLSITAILVGSFLLIKSLWEMYRLRKFHIETKNYHEELARRQERDRHFKDMRD